MTGIPAELSLGCVLDGRHGRVGQEDCRADHTRQPGLSAVFELHASRHLSRQCAPEQCQGGDAFLWFYISFSVLIYFF
jgi:hypothetical protein